MTRSVTSDLWWKNAIVYCLDVETYLDWDGDGIGDLAGLTERIDYIAGMGVTCLWLMPFYPTPGLDDGYDIADYYSVDPRLGSLGDFVVLIRTAKDRGLRVIIDLVVNHTSDKHPWFRSARSSPNSKYRDFYVWRDEPGPEPEQVVFPDAEDSVWTYDERAGQYYLHHFYSHQPDLNIANPEVRDEITRIAGFWLELGVDGFRVDAVPFLFQTGEGEEGAELDPHRLLKELRAFITRRSGESILLGEVNLPPKQLAAYFGDAPGDEMQMLFTFPVMQAMYLSLARKDARPLARALKQLPEIPPTCQWANFVRNHDELTLDQLSDKERQDVFEAFGPEPEMQLFGRGLRRRLPPMLEGDEHRIRQVYSLLLSLPGTPVLFYGEEIGMGEHLESEGRMSVRTPMQWTDQRNGGFSPVPPSRLARPVVEGRYGPMAVNVAEQRREPDSLLNWFERMLRRRRETPELGMGRFALIDTGDRCVLAHRVESAGSTVVVVHNLSDVPRHVTFELGDLEDCECTDLLALRPGAPIDENGNVEVKLDAYGYRWFRIQPADRRTPP